MARLQRGESELIDKINDLVLLAKTSDDNDVRNSSMAELLKLFRPLILKLCKKWSEYFNDTQHNIKRFDELIVDSEYWFMKYTLEKYEIDGVATFNTFIKNHLDQRIRYIYECELKYFNNHIFPDPDRRADTELDSFENVVYGYSSEVNSHTLMEDDIISSEEQENKQKLTQIITDIVNTNGVFNDRERKIFKYIIHDGKTYNDVGDEFGISRTRVMHLFKKIKQKLYRIMNNNQDIWDLINKLDIEFEEM